MTHVHYEELWVPWYIGDPPYASARMESWPKIPDDLIERFKATKAEMEIIWEELRKYDPRNED